MILYLNAFITIPILNKNIEHQITAFEPFVTRFYQRVKFCILKFHVTKTIHWYNTPHPQKLHSSWRLAVFFEAPTRAIRLAMRGQRLGTRLPLSQPTPRCKLHRKLDCELHEHLVISSLPQNTSETSASLNWNLLLFSQIRDARSSTFFCNTPSSPAESAASHFSPFCFYDSCRRSDSGEVLAAVATGEVDSYFA